MKKFLFLAVITFGYIGIVQAQHNIYTLAGTGVGGNEGINGPASSATLNMPIGVATDKRGNVYIADWNNGMVKKVSPDGVVTAFAGTGVQGYSGEGGFAVNAQLHSPSAILIDSNGNVIIADMGNSIVVKVDTFGIMTRLCGDPYYAGIYEGDGMPAVNAKINQPVSLVMDAQGNLYIAELGNSRIRKIGTDGIISTFAGSANPGYSGDGGYAVDAEINAPWGLVIDSAGNIYFAESVNHIIRRVRPSGIISTYAGTGAAGYSGDGASPLDATLNSPAGLAFDSSGVMYIADWVNNVIRTISADGSVISTFAGNGVAGYSGDGGSPLNASLNGAAGIAINDNRVYIADWANNVVRYIGPPPGSLPLQLLSFTGHLSGNETILQWHTTQEINVSHYELESGSSSTAFNKLGTLAAHNLATENIYTYTDNFPSFNSTGNIFYRVKMIDKDGRFTYSNVLQFSLSMQNKALDIYPNPVKNILNITTDINKTDIYSVNIIDVSGRTILSNKYNLVSGRTVLTVPVSHLSPGTYLLIVQHPGDKQVLKFIKE